MEEAKPLSKGYQVINLFAQKVRKETTINTIFSVDSIIRAMGGMIKEVSSNEYDKSKFVRIFDENNFDVTILNGLDNKFKRLLLIQALGHYMIHGDSGKNLCCINSASKNEVSLEGFWFALSLLIPDEQFINLQNKFNNVYLANLFRVPEFAIAAKRKIMKQVYFDKESI